MENKRKRKLPRRPRKEVDKKTGRKIMTDVVRRADGSIRGGRVLKDLGLSRPDRKPKPKAMTPLKRPGTLRPSDKAAINKKMRVIRKSMNKGGKSDFGMLSVRAGVDKNPKPLAKGGGSDTHVTKDGRTVKKGLYYYMNRAKKRGTSRKGKGTVTDKALARSAKTAKKPAKKKKA